MPLFEYECEDCGIRSTLITSDRDMDMVTCSGCGGNSRRLMSVVNNTFGWRLTDASHEEGAIDELERDV